MMQEIPEKIVAILAVALRIQNMTMPDLINILREKQLGVSADTTLEQVIPITLHRLFHPFVGPPQLSLDFESNWLQIEFIDLLTQRTHRTILLKEQRHNHTTWLNTYSKIHLHTSNNGTAKS